MADPEKYFTEEEIAQALAAQQAVIDARQALREAKAALPAAENKRDELFRTLLAPERRRRGDATALAELLDMHRTHISRVVHVGRGGYRGRQS